MLHLLDTAVTMSSILTESICVNNTAWGCGTRRLLASHHLELLQYTTWTPQNLWLSYEGFTAWFSSPEAVLVKLSCKVTSTSEIILLSWERNSPERFLVSLRGLEQTKLSKKLMSMPSHVQEKKGEYPQTYCSFISVLQYLHVSCCTKVVLHHNSMSNLKNILLLITSKAGTDCLIF